MTRRRHATRVGGVAILATAVLAASAAATACAPLRLEPTNAGFGNAFQALFEGFKRAARCGATLQLVDGANRKEKSRYRRICDRLTCSGASFVSAKSDAADALSVSFKNALLPVGCPAGCAKRPIPRETRVLRPAFEAANGGRWLAPLTCVGPNAAKRAAAGATRPFTTAAHIRSIRYDFERPPERVKKDRRGRHPANISLDENEAEWAWLATAIYRGGAVFIASDNAPARDKLVRRIAARNRTACYVGRDDLGHSSYHHSSEDDDHALTDWWVLAHVTHTIVMVGLPCAGKTADSCFFQRGCEGPYSCRSSSFSGTAHRLIGRNRYVGTNHLPGGSSRGPAANPRSLVHTEDGIRTVRLQRRRAPRRRRIGPSPVPNK